MARGITITNYLSNGNPEGIIFSYMSNWSGQAIKVPRNLFAEAKSMQELQRPGLYLLLGANIDNPEDKMVYVGEANNLAQRISQHLSDTDKAFAETIVCFCSKDENLTVSHTKYLEQKTISYISRSAEFTMTNRKEGSVINLPRMVADEMETYFDNMRVILPTLGFAILHQSDKLVGEYQKADTFFLSMANLKAQAVLTSNGIKVMPGSDMKKEETPALAGTYSNLRKTLQEKGIVVLENDKLVFKEEYEFSSPSTAAATLLGYSVNGRVTWKNKIGKTLKELEEEKIAFS
jgi:hypothetical protein